MTNLLKVDVNMLLPDSLRAEAGLRAIEINPKNMLSPTTPNEPIEDIKLAIHRYKKWPNGYILRIRFLEGHPLVCRRVKEIANQWTQYANLHFDFGNYTNAEIRISFNPTAGSWSYVGTDNLVIPQNQATMNFSWLEPNSGDEIYSQVVLHEFGHAIGCVHEHSTSTANIEWNKPVVYAYYNKLGWSKADVDYNIFYTFDHNSTNHTGQFDPQSIMVYPIPKEHTLNGFEVPWNNQLSQLDKQFITSSYPGE